MYLLKPIPEQKRQQSLTHSHSTMYLLKLTVPHQMTVVLRYSHSTMYLLKLMLSGMTENVKVFTFHHVSIKTK